MALAFTACNSDIEETVYDTDNATPASISNIDAEYVLSAQKSNETALTLNWTAPELGYQAALTNQVQMDVAGKDFGGQISLASLPKGTTTYSITHQELNNQILALLESYEMSQADPVEVEFRIATSVSTVNNVEPILYSNVVKTTIKPFVGEREYPQIWVIGDYCGWNHANSQFLYSANSDDNYAGMIYFDGKAANGWKLTPQAAWGSEWAGGEGLEPEATEATLVTSGGSNITAYSHNSYYFEFNKATGVLKVSKPHDTWGVVGSFTGWADGKDIVMTLASEVDDAGKTQWFLTATIDMSAGDEWKIRADGAWSDQINVGNIKAEGDVDLSGGDNFKVTDAGNYTIKWYFNKVEPRIEVIKN